MEQLPSVFFTTLVTGLRYPVLAACLGGLWTFGRVLFTLGYISGGPGKQLSRGGILGPMSGMALNIAATWSV
ncbi:hypothetical protein FRB99_002118, partial [Tulasnella sp. 403]